METLQREICPLHFWKEHNSMGSGSRRTSGWVDFQRQKSKSIMLFKFWIKKKGLGLKAFTWMICLQSLAPWNIRQLINTPDLEFLSVWMRLWDTESRKFGMSQTFALVVVPNLVSPLNLKIASRWGIVCSLGSSPSVYLKEPAYCVGQAWKTWCEGWTTVIGSNI